MMKLRKRKHMTARSRIVRGGTRENYLPDSLDLHIPQLFCPVRSLRPAMVARTQAGGLLHPMWAGKEVPRALREFRRAGG